jgi:DNA recombination protein RmuC
MQLGLVALAIANVVLLLILLLRKPAPPFDEAQVRDVVDRTLREQFVATRSESADAAAKLRNEVNVTLGGSNAAIVEQVQKLRGTVEERVNSIAADARRDAQELRKDAASTITTMSQQVTQRLSELNVTVATLGDKNEQRLEAVRVTVDARLDGIQKDNAAKLEQMRATVDEKLQSTLEARLGESFRLVSERLEAVHKGLGEMQTLASGVGDLKKVLTNVKTRGTWGEVQLGNLLEQIFRPEQYERNVAVKPLSGERVEYAIKLPGRERDGLPVWLPIDAKFPQEDYQRLVDAADRGDADAVAAAGQALENRIRAEAKKIRDKYICPPHTTEFAILFLPTEGLFAEVLRRPGVYDDVIARDRVVLAGPTTLAAVLNSLQMGFRTLALEQRSSEVWEVLGAVKTEFAKFGAVLEKVHEKLQQASRTIEDAQQRSRVMNKKLKDVEGLPTTAAQKILPIGTPDDELELEDDHADAAGAS